MPVNFTESDGKGQIMPLNNEQKKQYKSIGHDLKPVLIVAGNGLNEGVIAELERALVDHERSRSKFARKTARNAPRPSPSCARPAVPSWCRPSARKP